VLTKLKHKLLILWVCAPILFRMTLRRSSPALHLIKRTRTNLLTSAFYRTRLPIVIRRSVSSLPRPYQFHIGASWAAKPPSPQPLRINVPFSADTTVGRWRDETLGRWKNAKGGNAGEDFFFVSRVRFGRSRCGST
jgi:protein phosphatase PTC7